MGLDSIPVLVDTHGELCDRFGFRRKTTNVIVDRRGVVAAVGVRTEALPDLLKEMIAVDKEMALESKPEKRSDPKLLITLPTTHKWEVPPIDRGKMHQNFRWPSG